MSEAMRLSLNPVTRVSRLLPDLHELYIDNYSNNGNLPVSKYLVQWRFILVFQMTSEPISTRQVRSVVDRFIAYSYYQSSCGNRLILNFIIESESLSSSSRCEFLTKIKELFLEANHIKIPGRNYFVSFTFPAIKEKSLFRRKLLHKSRDYTCINLFIIIYIFFPPSCFS